MIKELRNEVANIIKREKPYTTLVIIERLVVYIIYLKYLCEIGKYEYEKVIHSEEIHDIIGLSIPVKRILQNQALAFNSLLRNYTGIKACDLLRELLNNSDKINFYNVDGEKICYVFKSLANYSSNYYSLYDLDSKTTYVYDDNKNPYELFMVFDEILGIKNKYQDISTIDYSKYSNLCIYYDEPRYLRSDRELFNYIYNVVHGVKNVYLYSKYAKISDLKNGRFVARFIKTIIIRDSNIVINFEKDSKEISIINGNNPKTMNLEELNDIIKKNRKQKDLLVKTTFEELRKNGMRIGFNLYQMEKDNNIIDINKIVDENTEYLKELNNLNEIVEREINKLFNL